MVSDDIVFFYIKKTVLGGVSSDNRRGLSEAGVSIFADPN
jgi:hypothetical protein